MFSNLNAPFYLQQDSVIALPVLHYTMEMAAEVRRVFNLVKPTCVAVEIPETLELLALHAASRLPDISVIATHHLDQLLYYLAEPCDPAFEALRCALEFGKRAFCIDLSVENYPDYKEAFPDPYAVTHIGYEAYYQTCSQLVKQRQKEPSPLDLARELHMARRLKELALRYEKVLFIGGLHHVESVLEKMRLNTFPQTPQPEKRNSAIYTLTEESCREVMAEMGWITSCYEEWREGRASVLPDRQQWLYQLFFQSGKEYAKENGGLFPRYHMQNLMKFSRNYALVSGGLMPDLYRVIMAARGCVDPNYSYEVWKCATGYPFLRNVDNLEALTLKPEEVWGASRKIHFRLKAPRRKGYNYAERKRKEKPYSFSPHGAFSLCSYPPEDLVIERFGQHLKKRGVQIVLDEQTRTIPFSDSLEDGIDMRETLRHWQERKLYVRKARRPRSEVGSVVLIFDQDASAQEGRARYPWKMTWIGEHEQESDMAFYSTLLGDKVVGPGISRCEYGGLMLSYPPRRLHDVWVDPDYEECQSKAEVLLMSAIDYCIHAIVVYVAPSAPSLRMKRFAGYFGKKIVYIPLAELSPPLVQKLRIFHVLDGKQRRDIAGEYIF